jgi:hypothetical protein
MVCCLFALNSIFFSLSGISIQKLSEQKVNEMIDTYFACLKQCENEKNPEIYKKKRKQCNAPFIRLLLELERQFNT